MVSKDNIRVTVTISKEQYEHIKSAAEKDSRTISSWLSVAAMEKLKRENSEKT